MVGIIHLSSMKNYMWMKRKKNVKRKEKKITNEKEKDENEMWEWNEKKRRKKRCNVMRERKDRMQENKCGGGR